MLAALYRLKIHIHVRGMIGNEIRSAPGEFWVTAVYLCVGAVMSMLPVTCGE